MTISDGTGRTPDVCICKLQIAQSVGAFAQACQKSKGTKKSADDWPKCSRVAAWWGGRRPPYSRCLLLPNSNGNLYAKLHMEIQVVRRINWSQQTTKKGEEENSTENKMQHTRQKFQNVFPIQHWRTLSGFSLKYIYAFRWSTTLHVCKVF